MGLHWTACALHRRIGTYWYMLPMATQARKAVWDAINPHTGRRRIDEAFPHELRNTTRENEMLIKFKCGSTWQVVGSDNFNALVGSPPIGIVYSEWALSNPASRAYLRPIMLENGGWQMFNTTPRGKNHAWRTFNAALKDPDAFAQLLSAYDTKTLSAAQLIKERQAYRDDFGQDQGDNLFEQEYECSWEAALLGAFYARELKALRARGSIGHHPYDPNHPVYTSWDLGFSDDTAIWFFQIIGYKIRFIRYYACSGEGAEHYAEKLEKFGYRYAKHWVPHDAAPKTFASPRSVLQQLFNLGVKCSVVPSLSVQDGIQAARTMLTHCEFHEEDCLEGLDCLAQYQREWDDDAKIFKPKPLHNWASHGADAFRMAAVGWKHPVDHDKPRTVQWPDELSFDEVMWPENQSIDVKRI
jgi:hypothetical protein